MNTYRRFPRRTKNLHANYLGGLFSGVVIGIFFAAMTHETPAITWEDNLVAWLIVGVIAMLLLWGFYRFGLARCSDTKEKESFHDSFFIGILTAIVATLLILNNEWIKQTKVNWLITLALVVMGYLLYVYVVLKIPKPK